MNRALFSEYRSLYSSDRKHPTVIRIRIRMRDLIDPDCMRHAVDMTMTRYPYLCVELKTGEDNRWEYIENKRPVVITNSLSGAELNSEASNYHIISFSWKDNWIVMDVSHAVTDGTGQLSNTCYWQLHLLASRHNQVAKLIDDHDDIRHVFMTVLRIQLTVDELLVILLDITCLCHFQKVVTGIHLLTQRIERMDNLRDVSDDGFGIVIGNLG